MQFDFPMEIFLKIVIYKSCDVFIQYFHHYLINTQLHTLWCKGQMVHQEASVLDLKFIGIHRTMSM